MARFITLHREILQNGGLKIVEAHVNVEHITHVSEQTGSGRFTFVGLTGSFLEVTESTEEIMKIIGRCHHGPVRTL